MTVPDSSTGASFDSLGAERFVSLTTVRKNGTPVATAVWVATFQGALVVTTPAASGKVKRLRNNPRVTLRPCSRSGKVDPAAPTVEATAQVLGSATAHPAEVAAIRKKYGIEYRVIIGIEALTRRLRRHTSDRFILRITPVSG